MIDFLALQTAQHIKKVVPNHPASINVLKHALSIIINMVFVVLLTLLMTLITGALVKTSIIVMLVFAILRQITGGYHMKSGMGCVIASSLLFVILSMISLSNTAIVIINIASIGLILIYAPSNIEKQSRIPQKYYIYLKLLGAFLVATNLVILSSAVGLAVFAQSLLLIRWRR